MNSKAVNTDALVAQLRECAGSDMIPMERAMRLMNEAAEALAAPAEGRGETWKCQACGSDKGAAGSPYWTGMGSAHDAEAIWQCDECKHKHTITLYETTPPAADSEAVTCSKCGVRQPLQHSPDCGRPPAAATCDDDSCIVSW